MTIDSNRINIYPINIYPNNILSLKFLKCYKHCTDGAEMSFHGSFKLFEKLGFRILNVHSLSHFVLSLMLHKECFYYFS